MCILSSLPHCGSISSRNCCGEPVLHHMTFHLQMIHLQALFPSQNLFHSKACSVGQEGKGRRNRFIQEPA
ncbi:hypothetical protein AMELA_G00073320 [Ameiurus melas]|uniref:Uncharacterized protein n=1 Tax=Ameiurus melas TaxID=219545 RepID=A0A7J6AZZ1_AMEME|nr:hypothetical protein AMELA_G00073320 [Ameiurus melas]